MTNSAGVGRFSSNRLKLRITERGANAIVIHGLGKNQVLGELALWREGENRHGDHHTLIEQAVLKVIFFLANQFVYLQASDSRPKWTWLPINF